MAPFIFSHSTNSDNIQNTTLLSETQSYTILLSLRQLLNKSIQHMSVGQKGRKNTVIAYPTFMHSPKLRSESQWERIYHSKIDLCASRPTQFIAIPDTEQCLLQKVEQYSLQKADICFPVLDKTNSTLPSMICVTLQLLISKTGVTSVSKFCMTVQFSKNLTDHAIVSQQSLYRSLSRPP